MLLGLCYCFWWHNRKEKLKHCVILFLLKMRICCCVMMLPLPNVNFSVAYTKPVQVPYL